MKKLLTLLFLGIFLISFASSLEFDNVREYDAQTKTVTITNAFGLGRDIATVKLNTPLDNMVARGYQKVAELNIDNYDNYSNVFNDMEFLDLRKGNEELTRDFDYKYKTTIQVPDYQTVCDNGLSSNGTAIRTNCREEQIGTKEKIIWEDIEAIDGLQEGVITIGIFTDVRKGDKIEWIPTLFGEKIDEWAVWTESLNTDLYLYFNFEETTGDVLDKVSFLNTTTTAQRGVPGIIGNGFSSTGQIMAGTSGYKPYVASINEGSINFWMNTTNTTLVLWVQDGTGTGNNVDGVISINAGNQDTCPANTLCFEDDDLNTVTASSTGITDGDWHMVSITVDGTTQRLYFDGVSVSNFTTGKNIFGGDGGDFGFIMGSTLWFGFSDEWGFWNRSLSQSEITQLYNGGDGITYTNIFPPRINLDSLVNNTNFTLTNNVVMNATIFDDTTIKNVSLIIDNVYNETNVTAGLNNTVWTFTKNMGQGDFFWTMESCDSDDACTNATQRVFSVDTNNPALLILAPPTTVPFHEINTNLFVNWSVNDTNLDTCILEYEGVNTTLTCLDNSTSINITNSVNRTITIYANDTLGNVNSSSRTWSYTTFQLNQTYEESITEGESNDFSILLNVSDGSSLDSAVFVYNETNYTTSVIFSSGLYLVTSTIVSPTLDADTNFTFNFIIVVDGISSSTALTNQTVLNSLFDICGGLSNDLLLNMSLFDEGTLLPLLGEIEVSASVISKSSGVSIGTVNSTFENVEFGAICFSPVSSFPLYLLDVEIRYESDGYAAEFYHIQQADMADFPVNLSLFDLNLNESTEFSVTYKNNNFIFTEGAIIQLQRRYIGDDISRVVEAPVTGNGGEAVLHIDLNTQKYSASVVKDGVLLDLFENIVFSCESELSGECTHTLDGTVDPNNDIPIEDLTDFSYTVSINEDNQTVTVLFAVPSGTPSSINVVLEQIDLFGNLTSCNTTVITSAGSITCGYVDTIEKSILELSISKDDIQLVVLTFANDPELDFDGMNFFFVFMFMISLVGMAIASPEWMIIISVMVLMISGMMLLLQGMSLVMGLGAIAWVIIAAAIIIMKMSKQEDR